MIDPDAITARVNAILAAEGRFVGDLTPEERIAYVNAAALDLIAESPAYPIPPATPLDP